MPAGAKVALIGPSGAGKSSLLAAIAGFFPPVGGRILWQGADIGALPPGDRPLSILFQDQNLFPHLTVAQNAGMGLRPDLRLTAAERERVAAALAKVGLAGWKRGFRGSFRAGSWEGRRWRGCCCGRGPCCCWTSPLPRWARR